APGGWRPRGGPGGAAGWAAARGGRRVEGERGPARAGVGRLPARHPLEPEDDRTPADPLTETSPVLAGLVCASVQGRVALGPRAGARSSKGSRSGGDPRPLRRPSEPVAA